MKQEEIKIIGLAAPNGAGILKAFDMTFDPDNRLTVIHGRVGQGKTTVQTTLKTAIQGSKTMQDKALYGDYKAVVPLLDGEEKIYVEAVAKSGKITHTIYSVDADGKKKAIGMTPAKYLAQLTNELTWNLEEFVSENPTVQKNLLLKLYQHELKRTGVIFEKNNPKYTTSILGKIDKAEKERDYADSIRKGCGGIADDLKARGVDPDKPSTVPDYVDIEAIRNKIQDLKTAIAVKQSNASSGKNAQLGELKNKLIELKNNCVAHNAQLQSEHTKAVAAWSNSVREIEANNHKLLEKYEDCKEALKTLSLNGYKGNEVSNFIGQMSMPVNADVAAGEEPKKPNYISIEGEKVTDEDTEKPYIKEFWKVAAKYGEVRNSPTAVVDVVAEQNEVLELEAKLIDADNINSIVKAVDAFHAWRGKDATVRELRAEYAKLLGGVNTGVEGLKIVPEEINGKLDVYLKYNGAYDPMYFNNNNKEYRKLSSYSDTQKPMICLLVQHYLLSKKAKALRYLFIDRIPIDNATKELLAKMCTELNLRIMVNVTGDFDVADLSAGECLIEGGEVFFND